ncbi:phosphatase PAP2 family protein [Tenacibaculum sp.]|uniref:phosphatase PAP2 family protein n=1 Tax=Tenacibaculum sp. TaxID=1906242 RepID=UPI003AA8C05D
MLSYKGVIYLPQKVEHDNHVNLIWFFLKSNIIILTSIAVLFLALYFSITIPKGELLIILNKHHTNFLDIFFKYITYLGDAVIYIPLAILIFFLKRKNLTYLIYLLLIQTGISWVLKKVIFKGMARPKAYFDTNTFELLHKVSGINIHSLNSFPSGHTLTAFSLAFFFIFFFKLHKYGQLFLFVLACFAGLSRVYLLQHFLIDISFGAFLGFLTAVSVLLIKKA